MPAPCVRIHYYSGCDTCHRAIKFLQQRDIPHEAVPIREQPPSLPELQQMLNITGGLRRLFNTSGRDCKAMNLTTRLPTLTDSEAIDLLSKHGNLARRPFLLLPDGRGTTGFKVEDWQALFP